MDKDFMLSYYDKMVRPTSRTDTTPPRFLKSTKLVISRSTHGCRSIRKTAKMP